MLIKGIDASNDAWKIFDTARSGSTNPADDFLSPNNNNAEVTNNNNKIDMLSDGFQIKTTGGGDSNYNNFEYIYAAFASKPDGSVIDSLIDTPTNYDADSGNNGGNYCTVNPLAIGGGSLSNGNLEGTVPTNCTHHATFAIPASGKYYFEAEMTNSSGILNFGLAAYRPSGHIYQNPNSIVYSTSGVKNVDAVTDQSYGASWTVGDIIGCACDADAGTITFYKNGSSQGSLSHQIGGLFPSFGNGYPSTNYIVNFGARPFAYTPPTNHKSLCTQNLPDPTIAEGSS